MFEGKRGATTPIRQRDSQALRASRDVKLRSQAGLVPRLGVTHALSQDIL